MSVMQTISNFKLMIQRNVRFGVPFCINKNNNGFCFFVISHTTSVGMTLILVSFFLIIILFILATKWSRYN